MDPTGSTEAMLDAMENLMTGGTEFDPDFEQKLYTCMDQINPMLKQASVNSTGNDSNLYFLFRENYRHNIGMLHAMQEFQPPSGQHDILAIEAEL